jgi:hypothetical protein
MGKYSYTSSSSPLSWHQPTSFHEVAVRELADRVHLCDELMFPSPRVAAHRHLLHGKFHAHPLQVSCRLSAKLSIGTEVGSCVSWLPELEFHRTLCVGHLLMIMVSEPSLPC